MTERLRPLLKERKVIVAGSTFVDEEKILLKAFHHLRHADQVFQTERNTVLVLAPRHPQRFAEVATIIESFAEGGTFAPPAIHASKLSDLNDEIQPGTVVLLDTLGDLAAVYQLADVALVGGSLTDAGGHNPLEPARFGVPVIMGPCYDNFREIVVQMITADAIRITTHDYLAVAENLLKGLQSDSGMGLRGKSFYEARTGATDRTVEALRELIGGKA
jgi:3-deoxy-D-manno-octulosonic-acid transferase